MDLSNLFKATKIIETIENYSIADSNEFINADPSNLDNDNWIYSDEQFWSKVISEPEKYWNKNFNLYTFTVCDWVARIPGLYWADFSVEIRKTSKNEVAIQSKQWIEFNPPGKSKKVLGGIGTILLPPNDDGKRLLSISSSCNASLGIPILIFPEVIDAISLKQGDAISIKNAKWQPLDLSWSKRFASTQGIPRGCFIIDSPNKIEILERNIPVSFQPFSIMEYQKGDALLYDYVYLTIDSKINNLRKEIEMFFNYYAKKENRNGKYLINPNMIEPYFETQFSFPSEMQHQSEKAKLQLIYRRIKDLEFSRTTLNDLIEILPSYYDSNLAIRRLAKSIGVSAALLQEDNAASMASQLINYCYETNKIEELTDRMIVEYPIIFNKQQK